MSGTYSRTYTKTGITIVPILKGTSSVTINAVGGGGGGGGGEAYGGRGGSVTVTYLITTQTELNINIGGGGKSGNLNSSLFGGGGGLTQVLSSDLTINVIAGGGGGSGYTSTGEIRYGGNGCGGGVTGQGEDASSGFGNGKGGNSELNGNGGLGGINAQNAGALYYSNMPGGGDLEGEGKFGGGGGAGGAAGDITSGGSSTYQPSAAGGTNGGGSGTRGGGGGAGYGGGGGGVASVDDSGGGGAGGSVALLYDERVTDAIYSIFGTSGPQGDGLDGQVTLSFDYKNTYYKINGNARINQTFNYFNTTSENMISLDYPISCINGTVIFNNTDPKNDLSTVKDVKISGISCNNINQIINTNNISFTVPSGVESGDKGIMVIRTNNTTAITLITIIDHIFPTITEISTSFTQLDTTTIFVVSGDIIDIYGTGFLNEATVTLTWNILINIKINTTFISSTQVRFTIPPLSLSNGFTAGTSYTISLSNPNINSQMNPNNYLSIYSKELTVYDLPTITRPSALSILNAIPGDTVSIIGTYFIRGATVTFGTTLLTSNTTFISATMITFIIPVSTPLSTYSISVTNPNNKIASQLNAITLNGPRITSVYAYNSNGNVITTDIINGSVSKSTSKKIIINGIYFATGATVSFGTSVINPTSVNNTDYSNCNLIVFIETLVVQPFGSYSVIVRNPGNNNSSFVSIRITI